jgi:signal peptidase I
MAVSEPVQVRVPAPGTVAAAEPVSPVAPRAISDEMRAQAIERVNRRSGLRWVRFWWEWTKSFCIALVLFLFMRAFLVEAFKIPSGSMEGTLLVGDFLLVNKLVYGAEVPFTGQRLPAIRTPRRGDIVVFQWPEDRTKNFVKRLVGLPGDTLEMRDGRLFVNSVLSRERYVIHSQPDLDPIGDEFRWQRNYLVRPAIAETRYQPSRNNWGPLIVPEKSYFVLGDNRDNSLDSRYWGFVPDSLLRGQPMFVYYSYTPDSVQTFAWITGIRWNRLGERVN